MLGCRSTVSCSFEVLSPWTWPLNGKLWTVLWRWARHPFGLFQLLQTACPLHSAQACGTRTTPTHGCRTGAPTRGWRTSLRAGTHAPAPASPTSGTRVRLAQSQRRVAAGWEVLPCGAHSPVQSVLSGRAVIPALLFERAGYWATFQSAILINGRPVPGDAIWAKLAPCVPGYSSTAATAGRGGESQQLQRRQRQRRLRWPP